MRNLDVSYPKCQYSALKCQSVHEQNWYYDAPVTLEIYRLGMIILWRDILALELSPSVKAYEYTVCTEKRSSNLDHIHHTSKTHQQWEWSGSIEGHYSDDIVPIPWNFFHYINHLNKFRAYRIARMQSAADVMRQDMTAWASNVASIGRNLRIANCYELTMKRPPHLNVSATLVQITNTQART